METGTLPKKKLWNGLKRILPLAKPPNNTAESHAGPPTKPNEKAETVSTSSQTAVSIPERLDDRASAAAVEGSMAEEGAVEEKASGNGAKGSDAQSDGDSQRNKTISAPDPVSEDASQSNDDKYLDVQASTSSSDRLPRAGLEAAAVLWDEAYNDLRKQDSELLDKYEVIVTQYIKEDSEGEKVGNIISGLEPSARRAQMAEVLESWLIEGGEGEFGEDTGRGHDLLWIPSLKALMRGLIRVPLDSPLPWVATCLGIETLFRHGTEHDASLRTITIASRMEWYNNLPRLLPGNKEETSLTGAGHNSNSFKQGLIDLYGAILLFQMRTVCVASDDGYLESVHSKPGCTQLDANIERLEQALTASITGNEVEAKLHQLLEEANAIRCESSPKAEPTSESADDAQESGKPSAKLGVEHRRIPDMDSGKIHFVQPLYRSATETTAYHDWKSERDCRVLWVTGDAGAGKTVLLHAIARRLAEEKPPPDSKSAAVAYFFCDANHDPRRENAMSIVKRLIWQLLDSRPELERHLEEKLSSTDRDSFDEPGDFYAMSMLLCSILQDEDLGPTFLLLDGIEDLYIEPDDILDLDAMNRDRYAERWGFEDLVCLIASTSQLSGQVKWLISARSATKTLAGVERYLSRGATGNPIRQAHIELSPTLSQVRTAIDEYASFKVRDLAKRSQLGGDLPAQVLESLRRRSPENFLWVKMACDIMESHQLPWNAPRALEDLESGVSSLYLQRKERLADLGQDDHDRCKDILSDAAIAFRPLSVCELVDLVKLPPEVDLKIMIAKVCFTFLEVTEDIVYFKHLSARKYLREWQKQDQTLSQAHADMCKRCLQIARVDGKDRPGSVHYAAVYWIKHLSQVEATLVSGVMEHVNDFLKEYFLQWLEMLVLQRLLAQALDHLQIANTILTGKIMQRFRAREKGESEAKTILQNVRAAIWFLEFHQSLESPKDLSPNNSLYFCPRFDEMRQMLPLDEFSSLTVPPAIESSKHSLSTTSSHTLEGHGDWIRDCDYSPDGRLVASASDDRTVRLWDSETGKLQHVLRGCFADYVYHVTFSPQWVGLLATSDSMTIQLWDVSTGAKVRTLKFSEGDAGSATDENVDQPTTSLISYIAFSPDGHVIIAATASSVVSWDLLSYQRTVVRATGSGVDDAPLGAIRHVRFSSDNGALHAWAAIDTNSLRNVTVWDVEHSRERYQLVGHEDDINDVAFSPDSVFLASGSDDSTVRIWDAENGQLLQILRTDGGYVRSVAFSQNGLHLACASGASVYVWKRAQSRPADELFGSPQTLEGHYGSITRVCFSPTGRHIISASKDRRARIWHIDKLDLTAFNSYVSQSPITATADGVSQQQALPSYHRGSVSFVTFSPDGGKVATASIDGSIVLWDANKGTPLNSLAEHERDIQFLAFSHCGNKLVSASNDRTVDVWDTGSGAIERKLVGHSDWVRCAVFSPDGQLVASASDDKTVRIWDIKGPLDTVDRDDGEEQGPPVQTRSRVLSGHEDYVFCVAFSPEGSYLASGGDDCDIRIWDLKPPVPNDDQQDEVEKSIAKFKNKDFNEPVRSLVFSPPEGKALITTLYSGKIIVWENTDTQRQEWSCRQKINGASMLEWDKQPFRMLRIYPRLPGVVVSEFGALPGVGLASRNATSAFPLSSLPLPPKCAYGLRRDDSDRWWITRKRQNWIFLPDQFRPNGDGPCTSGVYENRVVVGCESGQVLIFKFPKGTDVDA